MKTKLLFLAIMLSFLNFESEAQETFLYRDLNPNAGTNAKNFKVFNGEMYFSALNKTYKTTSAEEAPIAFPNLFEGNPNAGVFWNNKVYLPVEFGSNGNELCAIDPTTNTTELIKDIRPGNAPSFPKHLKVVNNLLYFVADNGTNGAELWVSDGTSNGTFMLIDLREGTNGSRIEDMVEYNNMLYFTAIVDGGIRNLYKTDGTTAGTEIVSLTLENDDELSKFEDVIVYESKLFVIAETETYGKEIYHFDTTTSTTQLLKDIFIGDRNSNPQQFRVFNNELYFLATPNLQIGKELYKTDGTTDNTILVKNTVEGYNANTGLSLVDAIEHNGKLYMVSNRSSFGELWVTDGTREGTEVILDRTNHNTISYLPQTTNLVTFNNKIYFYGAVGSDFKLCVTDGTNSGTSIVEMDVEPYRHGLNSLTVFESKLFFIGNHPEYSYEIFYLAFDNTNNDLYTLIPDENFEQYLIDEGIDNDNGNEKDGRVLTANISSLTSINLDNKEISDLTGIQDFTALTSLSVKNNNLSEINLSTLVNLDFLNISNNNISNFNYTNSNLRDLSCGYNNLSNIDLSGFPNLEFLSIFNNNLSTLDISANSKLKRLYADSNNITTINVAANKELILLNIGYNPITELDVTLNSNLEELSIINANLTSLDVSANTKLIALTVPNNNLSQLNAKNGNNVNIKNEGGRRIFETANNPNLACIQVDDATYATTNFTEIDATSSFSEDCAAAAGLTFVPDDNFEQALIDMGLDTGDLDDYVTTDNINSLTSLDISAKQITDLTGIQDFAALETLNISGNLLNGLVLSNPSLSDLNCSNNNLVSIDIVNLSALLTLNASQNKLTTIDTSGSFDLGTLDVSNNELTELMLLGNYNLANLNCSNNKLTTVEIGSSFALTEVDFSFNKLKNLSFAGIGTLTKVVVNDNELVTLGLVTGSTNLITEFNSLNNPNLYCIEVDDATYATDNFTNKDDQASFSENCNYFDQTYVPDDLFEQALIDLGYDDFLDDYVYTINIKNLKSLEIQNVNIDDLTGLQDFVSLETLVLKNLSFDTIDLSPFKNLKVLNLFRNLLQNIDVTTNTTLEELYLSENRLTSLDLSQNTNLEKLGLNHNEFTTTLDLSANVNLKVIDMLGNNQGNQITSIDFSNNTLLEEVQLQGNSLTEIDITANTNLTRLFVPGNNISSIDVSNNLALERLSVSSNNLSSLDVSMLENLGFLYTSGNNLTCVSVFDVDYANQQFTQFADLQTKFVSDCSDLVYIADPKFEQELIDRELDDELDNFVSKANIINITILNVSGKNIDDLTGIEHFENLEGLYVSENNLTSLNVSQNTKLRQLVCHTNQLTSLDVTNNPLLTNLGISINNISSLDISQNPALITLGIGSTDISSIDLSNNLQLENLSIINNNFFNLDISANLNLKDLNVRNNQLSTLDISNNFRLTEFYARSNNLTCIKVWDAAYATENWSDNIDDTASFSETCNVTEIPDSNFEQALIDANIDDVLDGFVLTENAVTTKALILISKNITDLTGIEAFTGITSLSLKGNNLTSIDLSQNTALTSLNVIDNQLDRLDISNNTALVTFEASSNPDLTCIQVWDINYANNNWSDKIDGTASFSEDCNDVWTVEVDKDVKDLLTIINGVDKNNDGEITLKEAKEFVGELDLSDKNIKDIKGLQAFENITSLNLSGNDLKDLSALTGKKITLISKTTGKKREVTSKAPKLETLIVSNNSFETLNLEELKDLKVINVSNNPNLGTMSIKNGSNASITTFNSANTPNMSCIIVDDKNATYLSNWTKDSKSSFVANLADCRSKVLSTQDFLQKDVKIYPNPVTNILQIESVKNIDFIEIYTTLGKRVMKTSNKKINFSNYSSGMYILKIVSGNRLLTKRVMKN